MLTSSHEKPFSYIDLLGKRFEYGGRGPDRYDCYGLAMEVQRRRGVDLPDVTSPTEAMHIHYCALKTQRLPAFTSIDEPEPWCIVMFQIRPPWVSHVGVLLEDGKRFIHIMHKRSVTVEQLDSDDWQKRIAGYLRCS